MRTLLCTLLLPALAAPAFSQGLRAGPQVAGIGDSVGLSATDTGLVGGAASYEARFDARGVTFVPVLGTRAPVEQSLRFEARSITRGGVEVPLAADVPHAEGLLAVYERAPGIRERYEVRREGIAQSFVIDRPLPGSGDVIVRGRIAGTFALAPERDASGALTFRGAYGDLCIGALTGIDADGRQCAGELRLSGDELALVLPAAFADTASWPLVLDPLIGVPFDVDASTWQDIEPDVAWDASASRYLVVWKRVFSATSSAVRGQRLLLTGALDGSTIFFGSASGVIAGRPQVADANHGSRFVVAWVQQTTTQDEARAQACDPLTGALSSALLLGTGTSGTMSDADVGGEVLKNPYKQALVVWDHNGVGIEGCKLDVEATGDPVLVKTFLVVADTNFPLITRNNLPRISRTAGGASGYYAVAFLRNTLLADFDARVALLDRDGNVAFPSILVHDTPESEVAVDVDGGYVSTTVDFVVATLTDTGANDTLRATPVRLINNVWAAGTPITLSTAVNSTDCAVGWRPGKSFVAWKENGISDTVRVQGFDQATCLSCEGPITIRISDNGGTTVGLCMGASGGNYEVEDGLLVWNDDVPGGSIDQNIVAMRLDALPNTGSVQNLGGGCGAAGTVAAPWPPVIGNGFFSVQLVNADPASTVALLNLNGASATFPCGTCQILPFFVTVPLPVANGNSAQGLPLPCDPALSGGVLDVQWTVVTPSSTPCTLPAISFSDILRITIGS